MSWRMIIHDKLNKPVDLADQRLRTYMIAPVNQR